MFGILNLKKPDGVTSRDVVNIVQRLVKPAKVGHAGTLDPLATGVLLVCVGKATRLISLLQEAQKTYLAEFQLGQRSDTDDSTGNVEAVQLSGAQPTESQVREGLSRFVGTISQVPPAYSAVKVAGQRAYSKARKGENVTLTARPVTVYDIQLLHYSWPALTVAITCGTGTYIRSIARDLGEQLQCGGLMSALERSRIGRFGVSSAIDANTLTKDNLHEFLVDPIQMVSHLEQYRCTDEEQLLVKAGRLLQVEPSRLSGLMTAGHANVALTSLDGASLLAFAEFMNDRRSLQPRNVFMS